MAGVRRRLGLALPILVAVVGGGGIAGAQPAAATGWTATAQATPRIPNGTLAAVSCSSATFCAAVGTIVSPASDIDSTTHPIASMWDGTAWTTVPMPTAPDGGWNLTFGAVSCVSSSFCMAVGSYNWAIGALRAMTAVWDGTAWHLRAVAQGPDAQMLLAGVSCTSPSMCEAVGGIGVAVAEQWNGSAWTRQITASAPGLRSSLRAISCTGPTFCLAVGAYESPRYENNPMSGTWDGTAWTFTAAASPAGSTGATLASVSCLSATTCEAVGASAGVTGLDSVPLLEGWQSGSWTLQSAPAGASAPYASVACAAGTCEAVAGGGSFDPAYEAARWDGTTWIAQSLPTATANPLLDAVSCEAATECVAVGHTVLSAYQSTSPAAADRELAEGWNGSSWSSQPVAEASTQPFGTLSAVACGAPTSCEAVGYVQGGGLSLPIAEGWDGSHWSRQFLPALPGSQGLWLDALACASASDCVAVGSWDQSVGSSRPLAETWNGAAWEVRSLPAPQGSATLTSVACPTSTFCAAVGTAAYRGATTPLFEDYGRRGWVRDPVSRATTVRDPSPLSVACPSPTSCVAVGWYRAAAKHEGPVAVTWDGTTWTARPAASPGTSSAVLTAVACSNATDCQAVGHTINGSFGPQAALAEGWNGTSWVSEPLAVPAGASGTDSVTPEAVACAGTQACEAVGSYVTAAGAAGGLPLAESWNGTAWSAQRVPLPAGATSATLQGVACPAAGSCLAVGDVGTYEGIQGILQPFVSQYSGT